MSALVNDANALVAALDGDGLDERGKTGALALLALLAGQDVEPAEGVRRDRRAVADRPQGRRGPRDLPPRARTPGTPANAPRRAATGTGRTWPRTRKPGSSPTRS